MSDESQHRQVAVQEVLRDIAKIRRVIERVEVDGGKSLSQRSTEMHVALHIALFALAGGLLAVELLRTPSITSLLYLSNAWFTMRVMLIASLAIMLLFMVATLYLVIWRAARRNEESFDAYIDRNFIYLKQLSFMSDLFVKFVAVSLVILSGRADWVAAFLFICTGDYLLQGRMFVLPFRLSLAFGLGSILLGCIQLIWFSGRLSYPLIGFLFVCGWSLCYLAILRKRERSQRSQE